jgi:hypothetical protein
VSGPRGRTLQRALDIAGSRELLAETLRTPLGEIEAYLSGKKPIPDPVFHAALDIVARGAKHGS